MLPEEKAETAVDEEEEDEDLFGVPATAKNTIVAPKKARSKRSKGSPSNKGLQGTGLQGPQLKFCRIFFFVGSVVVAIFYAVAERVASKSKAGAKGVTAPVVEEVDTAKGAEIHVQQVAEPTVAEPATPTVATAVDAEVTAAPFVEAFELDTSETNKEEPAAETEEEAKSSAEAPGSNGDVLETPITQPQEPEGDSKVTEPSNPSQEKFNIVHKPTGVFEADYQGRTAKFEELCKHPDPEDPFVGMWSEKDARDLCSGVLMVSYFFNSKPDFQRKSGWGTQERVSEGGTPIAQLSDPERFRFISKWYNSVSEKGLCATIFHDSDNHAWYQNEKTTEKIRFVKVDPKQYDVTFSRNFGLNDVRYFFVHRAICANPAWQWAYYNDIFDVTLGRSPMGEAKHGIVYGGVDNDVMGSDWLRETFVDLGGEYLKYWKDTLRYVKKPMWSSGLMGGDRATFLKYLAKYLAVFSDPEIAMNKKGAKTPRGNWGYQNVNMPAMNYVLERFFPHESHGGAPFNSKYRKFENGRSDVWFIHK